MIHGKLKSGASMSEEQIRRIERGFAEKLGDWVRLAVEVDETLIGGFMAIIDGIVYDASYKSQLTELKHFLKE